MSDIENEKGMESPELTFSQRREMLADAFRATFLEFWSENGPEVLRRVAAKRATKEAVAEKIRSRLSN